MNLHKRYFYFGKYETEDDPKIGWEPGWEYRFRISETEEVVLLESVWGEQFAIPFEILYYAIGTLQAVQTNLLSSLIGAPDPNAQQVEAQVSRTE